MKDGVKDEADVRVDEFVVRTTPTDGLVGVGAALVCGVGGVGVLA